MPYNGPAAVYYLFYHNTLGFVNLVDVKIKIIVNYISAGSNKNGRKNEQYKKSELIRKKFVGMYGRI